MQKSNSSATLCAAWLVYKLSVFTSQFSAFSGGFGLFFFSFSINFYYFSPSVTFDARNWFLCSFAVQQGQNIVPGKPEEQPANNLVIRAQHNFQCPVRTPGCLLNCAQCKGDEQDRGRWELPQIPDPVAQAWDAHSWSPPTEPGIWNFAFPFLSTARWKEKKTKTMRGLPLWYKHFSCEMSGTKSVAYFSQHPNILSWKGSG